MKGVTFGTKHSYKDFGLILTSKSINLPNLKTETEDVPGMDGALDLTDAITDDVKFKNRKLSFTFTVIDPVKQFLIILSQVTNFLHGKKLRVVIDDDKNYYYEGRCQVNQFKTDKRTATLVIDCDVAPFKTELNGAGVPWIWDTFSFVDGIIYVNKVTVSGSATVNLINRRRIVSPTFTCTAAMTVTSNGSTYSLSSGTTTVLAIRLREGDNYVTFKGTGTVTIQYKGGSL